MKKFLLILVLFLAIDTCYLQSGWVLQKSGINGFIEGISCVDNQNCWAMGIGDSSGTIILHTTNGGDSWEIQFDEFVYPEQSGLYVQGNLIDFYDLNNGFFGGGWDSYLTSDGGKNWIHIHINYADNTSDGCEEVKYINNHTIWSISDGGSVIKSTDAGDTWEVCLNQSIMWNSLYILDSLNGWVTPGPSVFFTSDGGKNWVERIDTNHFVWGYDMAFTDINTGWLTGAVGQLYNTTDGGNTWNESQLDTSQDFLKQVYFTDKNHGWVLAEVRPDEKTTILYRTTDGGQNWHLDTTFPNEYINKIEFSDSLNSWAVGMDGHIWHTTNGGFTSVAENDHPSKSAIFSISPNPASDFLKVSSANIIGKEISIYSMLGNKLISVIAERRETKINIETLPIGVYL
ncbi:MAG: YCF48-related protein, partial [FCB group bacterium]